MPFILPEFYGLCFSRISRAILSVCVTLPSVSQRPLNTVLKTSTRVGLLSSIGLSEFCLCGEPEKSSGPSGRPSHDSGGQAPPDDPPCGGLLNAQRQPASHPTGRPVIWQAKSVGYARWTPAALETAYMLRLMSFAYSERILICIMRALFDVLGVSAGPAGSCGIGSGSAVTSSSVTIGSSVMMASSGLSGSLKSCSCSATASLSLSYMMGCCCCCSSGLLLLLLLFSSPAPPLTPSCPPAIGLRVVIAAPLLVVVAVLVLFAAVVVILF